MMTKTNQKNNENTNKEYLNKKKIVFSACGTYLKKEMQSIYRQINNLQRYETEILAEKIENIDQFPHKYVRKMYKFPFPRPRGNFILRFFFKYIIKKWPPPSWFYKITPREHPYNLHLLSKEINPDIIHVYFGHKAVKYHSMLKASKKPWIVSYHGVDVSKFMDDKKYIKAKLEMLNDATLILARSQSLLNEIRAIGCDENKLRLNHTLIPMNQIKHKIVKPPNDGNWKIIQACRLIEKKGIITFLKALKKIKSQFPNIKYYIAGIGPLENKIKQEIKNLQLEQNVIMLGWLTSQELYKYFSNSHIFVHPSEKTTKNDQEGIPNALIEAMASGLPIIATKHGGIPEAVTNNQSGILVEEKNPNQLASALKKILTDKTLLKTMSKNARNEAKKKFELNNQIKVLENYYDEAINLFNKKHTINN